jgi:hypothetical protein
MKSTKVLCSLALLILLAFHSNLSAQAGFNDAHNKISAFWLNARKSTKIPAERATIALQGKALPQQIVPLINEGILEYLNTHKPVSTDILSLKIAQALAAPNVTIERPSDASGIVSIVSFPTSAGYGIAYDVSYCASCSVSWMGIFARKHGVWELAAQAENPIANGSVHLICVCLNTRRLLAIYGSHWGDAHNRLDIRLYDANARHLHQVWSLLDQPEGGITIRDREIIVSSFTTLTPPFFRKQQIFEVTPEKVRLIHSAVSSTSE